MCVCVCVCVCVSDLPSCLYVCGGVGAGSNRK